MLSLSSSLMSSASSSVHSHPGQRTQARDLIFSTSVYFCPQLMHIKDLVKIMYSFNMAAIFVIFSIVITILSEFDLETLFVIHMCAIVGHITSISDQ